MTTTRRLAAFSLALILLAGGCSDDAKHSLVPGGPDYLANDSPDNVVANVVTAIEAMDYDGYAALLYDGAEPTTDGSAYGDYHFILDRNQNPALPEYFDVGRELLCATHLLGGDPGFDGTGREYPGVHGIALDLTASNVWTAADSCEVDGAPCPDGTIQRSYQTDMLVTLESVIEGTNVIGWTIRDRAIFYCLPVDADGSTEWRLWRWVDVLSGKSTEDASLSQVKDLYAYP